jgi:uncharacterized membrane protein
MKTLLSYLKNKSFELKMVEVLWLILFSIGLGLIFGAYKYHLFDADLIPRRQLTNRETYPLVFIHVSTGTLWFISGFFQFTELFQKNKRLHRLNGYAYFILASVSTVSLLLINLILQDRAPFRPGVFPPSIYTLICLLSGMYFIKTKQVSHHRAWMIRSMVIAMVMPLDRFMHGFTYFTKFAPVPIIYLNYSAFIGAELIIHKALEFKITRPGWRNWNYLTLFILTLLFIGCFSITAIFEYYYSNITGPFRR